MLQHILTIIYRNFRRFRSTFLINLVGLSTGLACAILIYLWLDDELTMDRFHKYNDRLFQVMTNQNRPDVIVTLGEGPGMLEDELPAAFPEIEYAVGSSGVGDLITLSSSGRNLRRPGQFAGEHFFRIFSYPLLQGRADNVLKEKNSIVLSRSMAVALFGTDQDIIGKIIEWEVPGYSQQVIVSGVFEDVSPSSSSRFDFVLAYNAYEDIMREMGSLSWGNHNAITYLLLKKNADPSVLNEKIKDFVKQREPESILTLFLKPYGDTYLYGKYEGGKVVGGRIAYVRIFATIALFIVVIACVNFMNLSTAKASRRIREVGIKKAMGADRRSLAFQYLAESLLMAVLSAAIAMLVVDLILPQFNIITGKRLSIPFDTGFIFVVAGITAFTGVVAGSYPALYLSGFSPANILKSRLQLPGGEKWARKGLVIFQFTLAIVFITAVWVIYRQMEFVRMKNLGFDKENVLTFKLEGPVSSTLDAFLNELQKVPGVDDVSVMRGSVMNGTSFTTGYFRWKGMDPNAIIQFEHLGVYYDMIELLGIKMVAGRSFSREYPSDSSAIIFNETAIKVMGLDDPVGETFNLWGRDYKIVGVVEDFHFQSLHQEVKPLFMRITADDFDKVLVKIERGRERETIEGLTALYSKLNPGFAFNFEFLDSEYQSEYVAEERVAVLSRYFASLAILISCLGLFGLASFTAERRLKEVGIRKVLGSSVSRIVYLLTWEFSNVILVAVFLAAPLSYFTTRMWLSTFAFRVEVPWWNFLIAGMVALVIAWLTVGVQAWKAANVNPVQCLRDE